MEPIKEGDKISIKKIRGVDANFIPVGTTIKGTYIGSGIEINKSIIVTDNDFNKEDIRTGGVMEITNNDDCITVRTTNSIWEVRHTA